MDHRTFAAYESGAAAYAAEWNGQDAPDDMYSLLREHFRPGPTADIGCGAGRDTRWLVANGFDARGFDASPALLREARKVQPGIRFDVAALPELAAIEPATYENVLCETVIMHLPADQITPAARSLFALLRPSGTLYVSWRVTSAASQRDKAGRLYAAFDKQRVLDALADAQILFDREDVSASSGKRVHRLIARRTT